MMKFILIFCLTGTFYSCYSQQEQHFSPQESECIKVFYNFTNYIKTNIKNDSEITDSIKLKYILLNYLFIDNKLDTAAAQLNENEISKEQIINLKLQLKKFFQFFQERENKLLIENLGIVPIRLSNDTFIYKRLTAFQKENTYIFYDKRSPEKTLGYLLFVPRIDNLIKEPRIWSWTLMFQFGKFIFRSTTGEDGHEFIFSRN